MAGVRERELLTFPSGGGLSGVQAATEASYLVVTPPSLTALQSDNTVGGPHGTLDITSLRITLESPTQIWACLVFQTAGVMADCRFLASLLGRHRIIQLFHNCCWEEGVLQEPQRNWEHGSALYLG